MDKSEVQPHTIPGVRGQLVVDLKNVQIAECVLRGMLDAATFYAKDNNYATTEGLNYNDLKDIIYQVRWRDNFDPIAIVQAACCHIEKVMGVFPYAGYIGGIPEAIEREVENGP